MAGGCEETAALTSPGSAGADRFKFLCSYGGRILPRPSDGQLKYVGGDTRVIAVPRSVSFSELKEKVASVFKAEPVIKYQMASEDLDALVSVTCDEDLHHMLDEHDRHEVRCSCGHPPRLRVFLFPLPATTTFEGSATNLLHPQHHHHHHLLASNPLEQRYIDAINGVTRTPAATPRGPATGFTAGPNLPIFMVSSTETSPTSTGEAVGRDGAGLVACGGGRGPWHHSGGSGGGGGPPPQEFHRVHSSPNLQHGHWQQQGLRPHGLHGAVEHEVGGATVGSARRRPPPLRLQQYHGPRYYSPAQTPRQEGGGCTCCGHFDELCGQRRGENVPPPAAGRQQIWE